MHSLINQNHHVGIVGVGIYLPEKRMLAEDIAKATRGIWTAENIVAKLGIVEKPIPDGLKDGTQQMGVYAAKDALNRTGLDPKEIDLILCIGEEWKEYPLTTSGIYIQEQIGATNAWAIDVQQRCCTAVSALKMAKDMMLSDEGLRVAMIVGGYRNGDLVDYTDPEMSMMYNLSAGGGAIILKRDYGQNVLLGTEIMSDGSMARDAGVRYGGICEPITQANLEIAPKSLQLFDGAHMKERLNQVSMDNWLKCIDSALAQSNKGRSDIDFLAILHFKKSMHLSMLETLGLSENQSIYLDHYGHMGQIDQILSLHLALASGQVKAGSTVAMVAAGIGYAWAAGIVQWGPIEKAYPPEVEAKITSTEAVLSRIRSGHHIVSALAAAEPQQFLQSLHSIADRVEQVVVSTCLPMGHYPYFENPLYKGAFKMEGWFYSATIREAHKRGQASYIPNHLHLAGKKRVAHRPVDLFVGTCSPVDAHGYVSLGLSATYERQMIDVAAYVMLEMNPNVPRTFGDTLVHISEIDALVPVHYALPELPNAPSNEKDERIGAYIAQAVDDGATLQLGIGGIPNAVAKALIGKKDLGIHTEMFTDGMIDLIEAGAVTGSEKTLHRNRMVATFALGTKRLYDYIHDNPGVQILDGYYVNNPYVIGQNANMVSVNTTIEIDLTGQCCSESIGHVQFSGTGGQADTAIGAQISEGGKSFIALYATANVKQADGTRKQISKIVPSLKPGAAVTLSRNDVDYVVTEYGIASLKGTSIEERVHRLIAIAAPEFRESLYQAALDLNFISERRHE